MPDRLITLAFCTYNRAGMLPQLIKTIFQLESPIPFELLVIDNNSSDNTQTALAELCRDAPIPTRIVIEPEQGISHARNRALKEALNSSYLIFIDDDEIPDFNLLTAAYKALNRDNAQCVGGKIKVDFGETGRPAWLTKSLMGFLGDANYGNSGFVVDSEDTPLWTGNIAYDMSIFRNNPELRFDLNYNRRGNELGGGEDVKMFRELYRRKIKMVYDPTMIVTHCIDVKRLSRAYFLKLHFEAGRKAGLYGDNHYGNTILGIPPFMIRQLARHTSRTLWHYLAQKPEPLRQAMNMTYAAGLMYGNYQKHGAKHKGQHA